MDQFIDRQESGRTLAQLLHAYQNRTDTIVLALPRGGVPVAYEIARSLNLPLDVFIVRKLGVPWHEELAMGAISMGNTVVFNQEIIDQLGISQHAIDQIIQAEREEIERRLLAYRGNRPQPELENKTVILVDDGIATGATVRAAILALQKNKPAAIILAVPVAPLSTCNELQHKVSEIVCPLRPDNFLAVGNWYLDFQQVTDKEVTTLLKQLWQEQQEKNDKE